MPEQALDVYLRVPTRLERRGVAVGASTDLCLIDGSWAQVRMDLSRVRVRATFIHGRMVFNRIDQAPA
jgi:hypothetical protein